MDKTIFTATRKQFDFFYYLNYDYDYNEDVFYNLHRYLLVLPYRVYWTEEYYNVTKYAQEFCSYHDFADRDALPDYLYVDSSTCFKEDNFKF
mmetsp:Transcript_12245/g.8910  ORF Transcript_12245/g.8910 Transcript_12245/m.8910 type:complete len:92 (+) Transcript_12245:229-504(+)